MEIEGFPSCNSRTRGVLLAHLHLPEKGSQGLKNKQTTIKNKKAFILFPFGGKNIIGIQREGRASYRGRNGKTRRAALGSRREGDTEGTKGCSEVRGGRSDPFAPRPRGSLEGRGSPSWFSLFSGLLLFFLSLLCLLLLLLKLEGSTLPDPKRVGLGARLFARLPLGVGGEGRGRGGGDTPGSLQPSVASLSRAPKDRGSK